MRGKQNNSKSKRKKPEQLYEVEKIISKKTDDREVKYLVKWEGYSEAECTWEPLENLVAVMDLVDAFEDQIKFSKGDGNKEKTSTKKPQPQKKITVIDDSEEESSKEDLKEKKTTTNVKLFRHRGNRGRSSRGRERSSEIIKIKRSHGDISDERKGETPSPQKKVKLDGRRSKVVKELKVPRAKSNQRGGNKLEKMIIRGPRKLAAQSPEKGKKPMKSAGEIEKDLKNLNIDPIERKKGSFEFGDIAEEIVKAGPAQAGEKNSTELTCVIRWKERPDGTIPIVSQVSNNLIKVHDPLLLIKFYESKLQFGGTGAANPEKSLAIPNKIPPDSQPLADKPELKEMPLALEKPEKTNNNNDSGVGDEKLKGVVAGSVKAFKKQDYKKAEIAEERNEKENNENKGESNVVVPSNEEEKKNNETEANLSNDIMEYLIQKDEIKPQVLADSEWNL